MATNTCPHCGHDQVKCTNSRHTKAKGVMRRRVYECRSCRKRFATEETVTMIEGEDVVITPRHQALMFLEDVDDLVRKHFGADIGMRGARGKPERLGASRRSVADDD